MKTFIIGWGLLCGAVALGGVNSASAADLVLSPSPVVQQRVVYYAGAPVVAPAPVTTYYAPSAVATTSYYAPAPAIVTTPAPAVVTTPAPTVTYYAPSVATPVTSYYTPTTTYYAPTTTYYAPTVTATPVTTYYAPTAVAAPVVVGRAPVVRSKVYYPYEPVRNFFKAITP